MNIFESNAAEFQRLHERLMKAVRLRDADRMNPARWQEWQEASAVLLAAFDRLSFPGGLERELARLKTGDLEAIELAVRFLEANPFHFRTGYNKEDIIRQLRKYPLSEDQRARLRKVILDRVQGLPVREMRSYARLASKVTCPGFEEQLTGIAASSQRDAARHARLVLESLENYRRSHKMQ